MYAFTYLSNDSTLKKSRFFKISSGGLRRHSYFSLGVPPGTAPFRGRDKAGIILRGIRRQSRAGYSPDTAQQMGSENLSKPVIKNAIDKAIAERSRRTGINQDRVIQEIAKLAFLNPIDVIDMDEATIKGEANRDDTACIASVKVKVIPGEDGNITEREVKTYDKLKALELLGKHLGMFTDKLKMEGNVPVVIMGDDQLED